MTDLGRGNDEQSRLDRARPEQCMPVRLSGGNSEGGRDGNDISTRFGDARKQGGEPQVVANGETELADRGAVDDDRVLAGAVDGRLAPALAGREVDVEQVDLVVARLHMAGAVDDEAAVRHFSIVDEDRERPQVNPYPMLARGIAASSEDEVMVLRAQVRRSALGIAVEQPGHFRREQH